MLCLVQVQGEPNIFLALPVCGDVIVFFEHANQMFCMLFAYILHPKIVHHEGELNGTPFVGPQTGDNFVMEVALLVEALLEKLLGNDPRLGKFVHPTEDFKVDVPFLRLLLLEVVLVDHLLVNVGHPQLQVLVPL